MREEGEAHDRMQLLFSLAKAECLLSSSSRDIKAADSGGERGVSSAELVPQPSKNLALVELEL